MRLLLLVSTLILGQLAGPPAPASADAAVVRVEPVQWQDLVAALADREVLGQAVRAQGLRTPVNTCLLVTRVEPGLGQPAFEYFSLNGTAWLSSVGRYQPASAVKVMASIGALLTLRTYGLTGAAHIDIDEPKLAWHGPVRDLVHLALIYSDNEAYNRLMAIAGREALNRDYLSADRGCPTLTLGSFFRRGPAARVGDSPEIRYREGARTGVIPRRAASDVGCCCRGTCVNLVEMQEVVRRILLHWELPPRDRFDLDPADVAAIQTFLFHARERYGEGPSRALGGQAVTWGRFGNIPGGSVFENGLITVKIAGPFVPGRDLAVNVPRFLVTAAIPYKDDVEDPDTEVRERTSSLTETALATLVKQRPVEPLVQRDAGEIPVVSAARKGTDDLVRLEVEVAPGRGVRAWLGRTPLPVRPQGPGRHVAEARLGGGHNIVVVQVFDGARKVGYRAVDLRLDGAAPADGCEPYHPAPK